MPRQVRTIEDWFENRDEDKSTYPEPNNNVKDMPAELAECRKIWGSRDMSRDEQLAAIDAFNHKYGRYRYDLWCNIVGSEDQIRNMAVTLPDGPDTTKGFISVEKGNPIGKYTPKDVSIVDLFKEKYPALTFDENECFSDGDYTIWHGVGDGCQNWIVVDTKNNAYCASSVDCKPTQLIPHDCYVGPFVTSKSAGFRHEDGTAEHMTPNSEEAVGKYLQLLTKIPNISPMYMPSDVSKLVTIATYFTTEDELRCATETLEAIDEVFEENPDLRNDYGATGRILRQMGLNETDYMAIAKLIRTDDKYDDVKLLSGMRVYNDDYSALITDAAEIERIQDAFGKTRECYYGVNSMTKTLEVQLGMVLNAYDAQKAQKAREDAMSIIDTSGSIYDLEESK